MPPNIAFQELSIADADGVQMLHVTGFSPDALGVNVVHRHIAVSREGRTAQGATSEGLRSWQADLTLPDGFTPGPATAIGIETHLVLCTENPMFATLTWSEDVTIT